MSKYVTYKLRCAHGSACAPSWALQPTPRVTLCRPKANGTRDLLGQCRPKLWLGPPGAKMETDLDMLPGQLWWAVCLLYASLFWQNFQAFSSRRSGENSGSTLNALPVTSFKQSCLVLILNLFLQRIFSRLRIAQMTEAALVA